MTGHHDALDPVCGMRVDLDHARADGLATEYGGREFAFCRAGCQRAFLDEPDTYAGAVTGEPAAGAARAQMVVVDAGMRRWYESCSCCLGDAYPDVKATLDAERAAAQEAGPGHGICEVAET